MSAPSASPPESSDQLEQLNQGVGAQKDIPRTQIDRSEMHQADAQMTVQEGPNTDYQLQTGQQSGQQSSQYQYTTANMTTEYQVQPSTQQEMTAEYHQLRSNQPSQVQYTTTEYQSQAPTVQQQSSTEYQLRSLQPSQVQYTSTTSEYQSQPTTMHQQAIGEYQLRSVQQPGQVQYTTTEYQTQPSAMVQQHSTTEYQLRSVQPGQIQYSTMEYQSQPAAVRQGSTTAYYAQSGSQQQQQYINEYQGQVASSHVQTRPGGQYPSVAQQQSTSSKRPPSTSTQQASHLDPSMFGENTYTETRKVSSVIVEQTLLGQVPAQDEVRYVEVPTTEEKVTYVTKKEVREVERVVSKPVYEYDYVERKVPQIEYREVKEEVVEYVDNVVYVPVQKVVDRPVQHMREVEVPVTVVKTVQREVPGPVVYVPVVKQVERPKEVLVPVDKEVPVIVAQTVKPVITDSGRQVVVDVMDYEPEVVPIDVHVAKPVDSVLEFVGKVSERHKLVNMTATQYNSILRQLNDHMDEQMKSTLPFISEQGQVHFLHQETKFIVAPDNIPIEGYVPKKQGPHALPSPPPPPPPPPSSHYMQEPRPRSETIVTGGQRTSTQQHSVVHGHGSSVYESGPQYRGPQASVTSAVKAGSARQSTTGIANTTGARQEIVMHQDASRVQTGQSQQQVVTTASRGVSKTQSIGPVVSDRNTFTHSYNPEAASLNAASQTALQNVPARSGICC